MLLLSCRRALGHSLATRTPPTQPFSDLDRDARGADVGDLVDSMVEGRITLEKVKTLEGRMRYQIDKLVRVAKEGATTDVVNDPLAFRPNPENLVDNNEMPSEEEEDGHVQSTANDGLYHAPRLAPMPYIPTTKDKNKARAPIPTSLAALRHTDPTLPYTESTSGLGSTPSLNAQSSRARYLKRLNDFEEEQFGRVMLGKKEARRRARDEETLAMGGALSGVGEEGKGRVQRNRGLEDEFADVLRDVDRGKRQGDGYDELRKRSKRGSVLERSRETKRGSVPVDSDEASGMKRKRSRFEMERKSIKKRR
ncbi:hypothetical protein BDZ89DRAFT_159215 [Hymenopellis radicata]|nr:hypothetical protein BDZ89DRAFT_159215 [Hymenopellis radicata]